MIEGIDIHHGKIVRDWESVYASGKRFVILKASEGQWPDPQFQSRSVIARLKGFGVGAYHFGNAESYGSDQAREFASYLLPDVNVLALDWEWHPKDYDKQGKLTFPLKHTMTADHARSFVTDLRERRPHSRLLVYTSRAFLNSIGFTPIPNDPLLACDLWLAGMTKTPLMPKWWTRWTIWQDAIKPCNGIGQRVGEGVDHDIFNGSEEEMRVYFGLSANAENPQPQSNAQESANV